MSLKSKIEAYALELGFDAMGVSVIERLTNQEAYLKEWLEKGRHGTMAYMENHLEKRVDPSLLVPGAKTVISLTYNYYNPIEQEDPAAPKISMYALGRDYHKVIKKKLKQLYNKIQEWSPETEGRYFVDSAPVMERDWAQRAGLGWMGKHTLIIHPKKGSYFFLAELVLNLDLPPDEPLQDYCGTCTRCIDACPTEAIDPEGYTLDASKCISYLTIELKEDIPAEFQKKMENNMYGCDICQEVCPWNRFSTPHNEEDFLPKEALIKMTKEDWESLTQEQFDDLFFGSAVKRTKYEGLKRNIDFLNKE